MDDLYKKAIEAFREIIDYEIGINVYDGKMILDLDINEQEKTIKFKFRPTSEYCPIAYKLANDIKIKLLEKDLFNKIEIEVIDHIMSKQINNALNSY